MLFSLVGYHDDERTTAARETKGETVDAATPAAAAVTANVIASQVVDGPRDTTHVGAHEVATASSE
jgi:hypothetical protein